MINILDEKAQDLRIIANRKMDNIGNNLKKSWKGEGAEIFLKKHNEVQDILRDIARKMEYIDKL